VTARRSFRAAGLALVLAAGCGNLQGLGAPATPLVTFNVEAAGDLSSLRPPGITDTSLQIALVWGAQWQPEPFCFLPPQAAAAVAPGVSGASTPADVIAAGCRDPFGFVPARADVSVPVTIDGSAVALSLDNLPATDLLVGDVSPVAYASLVFYDDRDGSGTLDLSTPHPTKFGGRDDGDQQDTPDSADIIYGASFLTMTAPDTRVAYLEGTFDPTAAFYPRAGCPTATWPADGFSVLGTGGFTEAEGLTASAMGMLPTEEDPSACAFEMPDMTVVAVAAQAPADVAEVSCVEQTLDGSTRYREPPAASIDFTGRTWTCAPLPSLGSTAQPNLIQLVVSGLPTDHCKGLTHYTLRGCNEDVACAVPDWDFTANPPSWWPCSTS
jgi:hypothetical protein